MSMHIYGYHICSNLILAIVMAATSIFYSEAADIAVPDSLMRVDSVKSRQISSGQIRRQDSPNWWWNRLKANSLQLNDTTVDYPKFLGFCVKVYNWGDKFFNSYDPEYVQGTGKRWKASVKTDNWADSYAFKFHKDHTMRLMSDIYCNAGVYLQYMAVSVGYSIDLSNVIGNKPMSHKKFEASFTCSLFSIDFNYAENTGGSYIRKYGDFNNGRLFKLPFPGVSMYSMSVDAYYFFNHKRYSQGAAYSFAKLQKRSTGSFILGFDYHRQNITFDMMTMPDPLKAITTIPLDTYRVHYNSYSLIFGYGYNLVFARRWIFNATTMPLMGISRCYDDSLEGKRNIISLGLKFRTSLTWNIGNYFLGLSFKLDGHSYLSPNHHFFNAIENLAGSVGVRF